MKLPQLYLPTTITSYEYFRGEGTEGGTVFTSSSHVPTCVWFVFFMVTSQLCWNMSMVILPLSVLQKANVNKDSKYSNVFKNRNPNVFLRYGIR